MTFHTYSLPEDGCQWLLFNNLGKTISESVIREQLQSLINVTPFRSNRHGQEPAQFLFILSVARIHELSKMR